MHADKHVLFYIKVIKSCAFLNNMQIYFLMQHQHITVSLPGCNSAFFFVVNSSVQGVLFGTGAVSFQL